MRNPYQVSAESLLASLLSANEAGSWGISEGAFLELARTVPEWPDGEQVYLSFRIRFGDGAAGMWETFERHVARIKGVFGEDHFWRYPFLSSSKLFEDKPVERLRLLQGNETHKPTIEWIVVDLGMYRKRGSVAEVRGSRSLADELLVLTWLYPDMIRALDSSGLPRPFAAGYEVNIPESRDGKPWDNVVVIDWQQGHAVCVIAHHRDNDIEVYSVPIILEQQTRVH